MCSACDQIDVKIRHLREVASRMLDKQTLDGIAALISEMEIKKAELHPE